MKKNLTKMLVILLTLAIFATITSVMAFAEGEETSVASTAAETTTAETASEDENVIAIDASKLDADDTTATSNTTDDTTATSNTTDDTTDTIGAEETTEETTAAPWYKTEPAATIGIVLAIVLPIAAVIGIFLFYPKNKGKNKKSR